MSPLITGSLLILTAIVHHGDAVINGEIAPHGFDYLVKIHYPNYDVNWSSGVLVSRKHILTSADSVYDRNRDYFVIIAERLSATIQIRFLSKIIIHPEYTPSQRSLDGYATKGNDVAVLEMKEPLQFGQFHKMLKLLKPNQSVPPRCIFAGWGVVDWHLYGHTYKILHKCSLTILSPAQCEELFTKNRPAELCAKDPKGIAYPGQGDEGGPLVCDDRIVGIYSRPVARKQESSNHTAPPVTFMKVSSYYDFIKQAIASTNEE
uniref:Gzmg_2 protein n=1 Tax=Fopius arisanus TaxID=64838 RepID=A0A0C9PHV9_9HYME